MSEDTNTTEEQALPPLTPEDKIALDIELADILLSDDDDDALN